MLKHAKSSPDYTNYLSYLVSATQQPATISLPRESYDLARSAAAIALKNFIKTSYTTIPDPGKAYIRSVILGGLQDPSSQMRNYSGIVITEVMRQGGVLSWPTLLFDLFALIENAQGTYTTQTQEGAIEALFKICEDNKRALDKQYAEGRPLTLLFQKLLEFTESPVPGVRSRSLASINVFLPDKSQTVMDNLPTLLQQLFAKAFDEAVDVRRQVCRSWTYIAEISPESIVPHLEGLVNYTLTQQKTQDESELALDAAEFWVCAGENDVLVQHLHQYLPAIVPVLLDCMVYSEEEMLVLEMDYDNADEEDRAEDIKPTFATSKDSRKPGESETTNGAKQTADDNMSEGEIEDEDDEDDDLNPQEEWTLRKCSAAALDVFAGVFHGDVFTVTLPWLKEHIQHAEWPYREAAVLALGAIAEGCMDAVQPHLADLTQYLLSLLQDKEPVVRQITCWTLGRYSSWAVNLSDQGRQQYFVPIMTGLLDRMMDRNKRVQESASSAFANLEERAKELLAPHCSLIIQQFVLCFGKYKDRNMFILYDCVQTLAEHVGPVLKDPTLVNLLMPALITRWNKVSDQSREMFPLLECLSYVASALNEEFEPFSQPIFARCIKIIHSNLEDSMRAATDPAYDQPEKDFLVTSLDLLSAIIQALPESNTIALVEASSPNMFELLLYCMKDPNHDVRQSAYALLGDCAVFLFKQLQPYLPQVLEVLIEQLNMIHVQYDGEETSFAVVNNACWSAGEIAMRQLDGMQPYVQPLLMKLYMILNDSKVPLSLTENAAVAFGRLGLGCPALIAPHLSEFATLFLNAIQNVAWTDEKAHALVGFVQIALADEQSRLVEKQLLELFIEFAKTPSEFLQYPNEDTSKMDVGQRYRLFKQVSSISLHCIVYSVHHLEIVLMDVTACRPI
jgi:transportin-1